MSFILFSCCAGSLLLCIPLYFMLCELPPVCPPLPELFGKPWFVAVARMNANKHSAPFSNLALFLRLQWIIIHLKAGHCLLLYNIQTHMRWKLTWINSMFTHSSGRVNVDVAFISQCARLVSILVGRVSVTGCVMIILLQMTITTNMLLGHICTR